PNAYLRFEVFGFHGLTNSAGPVAIRAFPGAAIRERRCGAVCCRGALRLSGVNSTVDCAALLWTLRNGGRLFGGGASWCEPPSATPCRPGATPPLDDVGVPPTVIATYSLPSTEKIEGPAAICRPVWNFQSSLPVFRSKARR